MRNYLLYFLIICIAFSCNANKSNTTSETTTAAVTTAAATATASAVAIDTFKTGEIITNIACLNDASKSFALYVPKEPRPLPGIIFFFDAHGDPMVPLTKYKELADEFKFVLAGSYDSKNGNDWNTTAQIWQALIAEKRITYDMKRIYTAGFSGGAKVASYIALNNANVAGVIANSAGFPETQQQAPTGNFTFLGIAGTGDMNMTDLITLNEQLDQTAIKHQLLFFDGKHEWCPEETMRDAFTWLHFNEVLNSKIALDTKWLDDFITRHNKKIERLKKENDLMSLANENKLMANYLKDGISGLSADYENAFSAITKSPGYQKQQSDYNSLLESEKNIKSNLAGALQQNTDEAFWQSTINDLNKQAGQKNESGAMYKRVVSYLSLACYSFSNRTLISGDNANALKYVTLYKIIDPQNSEAWYFSAMLNARAKNQEAAKADLQKAIDKGFNDWKRMQVQQEFEGLNLDGFKK